MAYGEDIVIVIEQNELVTLLVGVSALILVVSNRRGLEGLPKAGICVLSFLLLVLGLAFTVLEGLFWGGAFNILEHICYAGSSLLLAIWVWLVFVRGEPWPKT